MFKAAFIIYYSQIWKQPKCPSIGEWIKKMHVHTHTHTHTHPHTNMHTYIQWDTTQPQKRMNSCFATTWMNLEGIMLTEIREIMYVITNMWNLKIKTHKVYSKKNWTQMKRSTLRLYIVTLLI